MVLQQGDWSAREPNVWVQLQSGSSAMYEVSTAPLRAVHGSNVTVKVKGGRLEAGPRHACHGMADPCEWQLSSPPAMCRRKAVCISTPKAGVCSARRMDDMAAQGIAWAWHEVRTRLTIFLHLPKVAVEAYSRQGSREHVQ